MVNVNPFLHLLVAIPVFSYRITIFLKIYVALLFILICITLLVQPGLLIDQLASNTNSSNMSTIVGSYAWYNSNKGDKKKKNAEEKDNNENFWSEVLEKDLGQNTSNPHIIARRHLTSGNNTDTDVLNKILPSKFDRVLPEKLEQLISIEPKTVNYCDPVTKEENKKDVSQLIGKRSGLPKYAGIYIWTNMLTGEQYIGSSVELAKRVANYKQDISKNKARPIISNMSKYGLENFTLTIYLVELVQLKEIKDANIDLLRKIIILEQYLILTLKPSLNTVKVANTAPYTDHSELSPQKWNKMVTSMSQPIYIYLDDVLVFEAASAAVGARQLGIGVVSFFRNMKDGTKLFRRYTVSRIGPTENTKVSLIPVEALKKLFDQYRVESRVGLNTNSMKVLIKDTINNTETIVPSITVASAHTYNMEGRSVSVKTLRKWLDSGTIIKGWIFSKVTNL